MSENCILKAKDIEELDEKLVVHQFNHKAKRHTKSIGDIVGLTTIGVHLVRIEPGDETTQFHNHEFSDEFVYIISGNATLDLGDELYLLEDGDFVGFPKDGLAHSMKNTGDTDLVYLVSGGRPEIDVCNYPRIDRRMYIVKGQREYVNLENLGKVKR